MTCVLRWFNRSPTHWNKVCLGLIEKISHWIQYVFVFIELWYQIWLKLLHLFNCGNHVKISSWIKALCIKKIIVNDQFSQSVLNKLFLMGRGPVNSSQNTSYDQICDKNQHISQIMTIISNFSMTQKSIYTKNHCSQWLIFSISTKQTLFQWVGDLLNHLRTQVTTKSVTKNSNFTRSIKLGI